MNYLIQFILGILASLIAGYILAIIPLGKIDRMLPFKKLSLLGIIKLFPNQDKAINNIFRDCEKSKYIFLLAMKGETFSNPDKHLYQILNMNKEQKYLISSLSNPYVQLRGEELNMNMSIALKQSIDNFETKQKINPKINILLHKEVVRFRIIILDECLYLSFQEKYKPGRLSPVLKIKRLSPLYDNFFSLFYDLWEKYNKKNN